LNSGSRNIKISLHALSEGDQEKKRGALKGDVTEHEKVSNWQEGKKKKTRRTIKQKGSGKTSAV